MPRSARRGCSYGWCNRLAVEGECYCEEHLKQVNREYERYGRDPKTKKMYGRDWDRIRLRYKREHPFCEECLKHERLVPTQHIHHRIPLSEGGTHAFDNLEALCKPCHSRIHAKLGDRWGRPNEYK